MRFQQAPVEEDVLRAMTARLRHRGPDAAGAVCPVPWVGLGHTRLKVIDLSDAAAQPMASADRQVWIVYNGEVYNYRVLRAELEGFGRAFRSGSDTEVILQAYEQWGEDCIRRLDGMFALAIFDGRRQRLLLARDRTGKKPLYYFRDQERFVFASEIKGLLAHPRVPAAFEPRVLPRYLTYGYVPQPDTCFVGIRALPPATQMVVIGPEGRERQRVYWQLPESRAHDVPAWPEACAETRRRLTEAVRKRLIADVPLGAFLSGGLDSSIVVGLMSQLSDAPVHTFSIGFRGDTRFNETSYARLVAQRFRTKHTEFVVRPKAFELLEQLVYQHDQPFGDASAIPTFLLCRLAKEHITVALNGDGGDEVFAGYRRFQAAAWSARVPRWASAAAGRGLRLLPGRLGRRAMVQEWRRFFEGAARPWDERLVRWIAYVTPPAALIRPEWLRGLHADDWLLPYRRQLARVAGRSPLAQALYVNFKEYLPEDLHVKMDRCSMAHGLETRSPLLDTAVIEYVFGLPHHYKLRGGRTKALLRAACADLLPPAIQRRGKWGFAVPLDAWFRGELRGAVTDLLLDPQAQLRRYLDAAAVRALWEDHAAGRRRVGLALWNLLTLEVWLRMMARRAWREPEAGRPMAVEHG